MSEQEENAANFKTLQELKKAKAHLDALRKQSDGFADRMDSLAELLHSKPEHVAFQGASKTAENNYNTPWFHVGEFDIDKVVLLTDDIRAAIKEVVRLEGRAANFDV